MKHEKMPINIYSIITIILSAALLIGVIVWQFRGDHQPTPTDPSGSSCQPTGTQPSGNETNPSENSDPTGNVTDPTENGKPTEPKPTEPEPTEPEPTEPQPTEPEPTEPEPTEPKPTEPKPTEPKPTEPEPTEPQPTEPQPTEPQPTEPKPTEPEPTEPKVGIKEVNETVYATSTVNVRSGPGTSYEKLGQLAKGDKVTRTGICENGWSRVVYNGKVAYISSSYLTTTNTGTNANGEIIYTYPDGTTGTVPKDGAIYEMVPGVWVEYDEDALDSSMTEEEKEAADKGIFYCSHCGKKCGDGTNGTCRYWLTGGNHTCPNCGDIVPGGECHSCD